MQVSFYGHVRQYHNIKAEIDANMQEVLESGQYVMGPMLKRFEKELAAYHGTKYAIGVGNGTDAMWLSFMALGIGPGDECITTTNTFFATAEAIWIAGATAVFVDSDAEDQLHRPVQDRGRHHAQDQGHRAGPPLRAVRRHEGHPQDRRQAQALRHRRQRAGHRRPRRRLQDRRAERRRLHQLHHPEEPRHLRRRRRGGHQQRDGGPRRAQAAQPRLGEALLPQLRLQQPPGRPARRRAERQAEAHRRVERPAPQVGGALHRRPGGREELHAALRDARLPPRLPSLRHRDQEAGAARPAAGLPERKRHRRQVPLPDRHPPAGRLSVGQAGPHRRSHPQLRAQRRLLHLAADVPGADGAGSGLHDRQGPGVGPARRRRAWIASTELSWSAWASGACTMPPRFRPTAASRWPASATSTRRGWTRRPPSWASR